MSTREIWTTLVAPELTQQYGVEELHTVCFAPDGWPGKGTTISLGIPECRLNFVFLSANEVPVAFVNQPTVTKGVQKWVRYACELATEHQAFLMFDCNTATQAARAARIAVKWLPKYRRMALERMYNVADRVQDRLS